MRVVLAKTWTLEYNYVIIIDFLPKGLNWIWLVRSEKGISGYDHLSKTHLTGEKN